MPTLPLGPLAVDSPERESAPRCAIDRRRCIFSHHIYCHSQKLYLSEDICRNRVGAVGTVVETVVETVGNL